MTRFFFNFKDDLSHQHATESSTSNLSPVVDEDGDIIIPARQNNLESSDGDSETPQTHHLHPLCSSNSNFTEKMFKEVITIEHKLQTVLKDVGYQVWLGALVMCDYVIHNGDSLTHLTILDLGAGTGLTSIVAAMFAKSVICTDYSQDIVTLAEHNWKRNSELSPFFSDKNNFKVQVLDWTDHQLDSDIQSDMTEKDLLLYDATLLLAAEVIYDDDITDVFFQTIYFLLRKPPRKTVIMAVEKRIVFDMAWHDVCSPAYEHFQDNLKDLCSVDKGNVRFTFQQIPLQDIPQYFLYTRTAHLELWKITSYFPESNNSDEGVK